MRYIVVWCFSFGISVLRAFEVSSKDNEDHG